MTDIKEVFQRYEKKYMLNQDQYLMLMACLTNRMKTDRFGKHTICNLYIDTPDFQLIRRSIEKPLYKEKLRLRSYGTPGESDKVFLEIKKKYDGIVYKRRAPLTHQEAMVYLLTGESPAHYTQIFQEIDWAMKFYNHPKPKMYISYDRIAMAGVQDPELRITFDKNIRWRESSLSLGKGPWGNALLRDDQILMEIKAIGAMPVWLSYTLSKLNIFPSSFSKYGACYKEFMAVQKIGGAIIA